MPRARDLAAAERLQHWVRLRSSMDYQSEFYPENRFGGFTDIDGTIAFYTRVHGLLFPDAVILDVGCGRGEYDQDRVEVRRQLRIFKGKYARVIGIDVDDAGFKNPFLDEFHLLRSATWPLEDESVDLCLADCVMEH